MITRLCTTMGCANPIPCATHKPSSKIYDRKWRAARLRFLRQHPLCEHCKRKGIVTAASEVDHIIPHRGNLQRFWDVTNWMALCKPCHSAKTRAGE